MLRQQQLAEEEIARRDRAPSDGGEARDESSSSVR